MHEMNRVELYSLIAISLTICMGGYSNVNAGVGAGGSSWGCGGDVSWVDMVIIISNGLSILWMLVLLIFGGKSELVNQGRRLGSNTSMQQNHELERYAGPTTGSPGRPHRYHAIQQCKLGSE